MAGYSVHTPLHLMKKIVSIFILFWAFSAQAQKLYPAKWTFFLQEKKGGESELVFKVKLDEGWHLYSQFTPDGGPVPMVYTFEPSDCYTLVGKVNEPKPVAEYDSSFGVNTLLFHGEVSFIQMIRIKGTGCTVKGKIEYQACKESCILLDTAFNFTLGNVKDEKAVVPADTIIPNPVATDTVPQAVAVTSGNDLDNLEEGCGLTGGESPKSHRSYLGIFIAGMIGGLLALLTPCVFPMIPMTVSFFTKRSGSRKK